MTTKEIQNIQKEYDLLYWQHNNSEFEKIRHITLHMGKLLGKLSGYCENQEHSTNTEDKEQIKKEIIPDLVFYAAQLSNVLDLDLGESYNQRIERNKKFFGK